MKLVTFETSGVGQAAGALIDGGKRVADLRTLHRLLGGNDSMHSAVASVQGVIEGGDTAMEYVRHLIDRAATAGMEDGVHELDRVRLLAPIPRPVRLRCFSVYEKHMRQSLEALVRVRLGRFGVALNRRLHFAKIPQDFFDAPAYYKGNPISVIGHDQDVPWPSFPESKLDYELELGFVIGRPGQDIGEDRALEHVFGYTVYNDFSARGRMIAEMRGGIPTGPLKGKDFEGGNSMGPWIVTADEIPDPASLRMEVRVNGETKGVGSTADMHHSIASMIAVASEGERLCEGEFFGTGAVGDGTGIERWEFLSPGDAVELEIEHIGVLRNRVGSRSEKGAALG
ncbi:MAG: fumarylacetoacetate hydrolase family protein [Myxococcota bacterium]|nr:fumarylacetoacetate hydrolase family protein [Myxococcota bacterium]